MPIKRTLLLWLVLGFSGSAGWSQIYIGLSGGGGLNETSSLRVAALVEGKLTDMLQIQTGIVFQQQHNRAVIWKLNPLTDYRTVSMGYVGVPLLATLSLDFQSFRFYILGGAQVAYGVGGSVSYIDEAGLYQLQQLDYKKLTINRLDIRVNAGAGFAKVIRNDYQIFIEFYYSLGIYDIDKHPNAEIFNESQTLHVGLLLPLKKEKHR